MEGLEVRLWDLAVVWLTMGPEVLVRTCKTNIPIEFGTWGEERVT